MAQRLEELERAATEAKKLLEAKAYGKYKHL
jgi:hypothetical protein